MALGAPSSEQGWWVGQLVRFRAVKRYDLGRTLLEGGTVDPLVQVNGVFTGDDVVQGRPGLLGL